MMMIDDDGGVLD